MFLAILPKFSKHLHITLQICPEWPRMINPIHFLGLHRIQLNFWFRFLLATNYYHVTWLGHYGELRKASQMCCIESGEGGIYIYSCIRSLLILLHFLTWNSIYSKYLPSVWPAIHLCVNNVGTLSKVGAYIIVSLDIHTTCMIKR